MKGSQESLTTVVIKQAGPHAPVSNSTDGSRPESWQTATVSTGAHRQKDGSMINKLDQQVKNWATPRAGKTTDENPETWALRQAKGDVATMPLTAQVKQSWATPRAEHDSGAHKGKPDTLHSQIKTWPTPASAGVTGGPTGLAGGAGNREKLAKMLPDAEARAMGCGKLNPRWVETLMGLPVGWTMPSCASPVTIERMSSDYSVTVLSQQQQNEPSGS